MKILLPIIPLVLGLFAFASAVVAGETEKIVTPEIDDGVGLSVDAEFSSSGAIEWKSSSPGQANARTTEQTYTVSQSLYSNADESLTASIDYHQIDFDFEGTGIRPLLPARLAAAMATALYVRKLNTSWSYGALGQVGGFTAGRKEGWSGGGRSASFGLVAQYRVNPQFSVKVGAVYRTLAEGNEHLVPTAGLAWQVTDLCRFTIGFPRTALTYQLTDHLRLGIVAKGNFETYRMKRYSDLASVVDGSPRRQKLNYTEIGVSLEVEYACTRRLTLRAALGQVLYRAVEYRPHRLKLESRNAPPVGTFAVALTL